MTRTLRRLSRIVAPLLVVMGCTSDNLTGPGLDNQRPTAWLSGAPPEGSVSRYTIQMFWGGWDPDGDVAYYEYAISDNDGGVFDPADTTGASKWHKVFRNDSTFMFTANVLNDSTELNSTTLKSVRFEKSHTFFIRAVDDRKLASIPAYRSFTSRNLSPIVDILVPTTTGSNPALVPPITTFKWTARDFIDNEKETTEPDSVRWILLPTRKFNNSWSETLKYIRLNPGAKEWHAWVDYVAAGNSGKTWTSPSLEYGSYVFAIQAKDEAGAITPMFDEKRNVRRLLVSQRSTGPILTVFNKFIGTSITSSPNSPQVIIDLPPDVPMSFRWTADASSYGGVVSGYRYGWDVQDLSDDTQWTTTLTPFVTQNNSAESPPKTFFYDSHTFHVEVVDNSGYKSRASFRINIVPFTMQKNLLIVDDWKEGDQSFTQTGGGLPSDKEHDQFWAEMASSVFDFDPQVDMIQVTEDLPINVLADYRSLIWVGNAAYNSITTSLANQVIRFVDPNIPTSSGKVKPNIVSLFMAAGGKVLLCGEQIMTASINRSSFLPTTPAFPIIFRYELTGDQDGTYGESRVGKSGVGDLSFAYNECCLNVLDIAYIRVNSSIRRPGTNSCAVTTRRTQDGKANGLRYAIPMDEKYDFPQLDLRPEVSGTGKWFNENRTGLNCDIYNPSYFAAVPMSQTGTRTCNDVAEIEPPRPCFKPIFGNGCLSASSAIYGAPVAFWTTRFEDRVPEAGGTAGRSAVWGFHPVYFNPSQVKLAMEIVLFDEWGLPRKQGPSK